MACGLRGVAQSGHSPGKLGIVREFKSGQGKVREERKSQGKCVLACGHLLRILFSTHNVQERSSLSLLGEVVHRIVSRKKRPFVTCR